MTEKTVETGIREGLSQSEVLLLRQQYGKNEFELTPEFRLLRIVKDIFIEPMFVLLAIACALYFILGNIAEGIMMAVAVAIVTAISVYQETKSSRALRNLQQLTEPRVTVIRDRQEQAILNSELVPGDIMMLEEGMKIPADAVLLHSNDLSVTESVITGESLPVEKHESGENNLLYQGSAINSGKCLAKVTATGNNTILGKIRKTVVEYQTPKTLLQVQVNAFVKKFAFFGLAGFALIFFINYLQAGTFVTSLLFALTLAMSAIPEEIPVAFSSFMALGAYKMSRLGIISRQPQIIENLGAVTVLCLDKTGTITENKMELKSIYSYENDELSDIDETILTQQKNVLSVAVLASETDPFDPMEKAILEAWTLYSGDPAQVRLKMVYEYPLEGRPPMMTHVYQQGEAYIATAKGAAERIISICKPEAARLDKINMLIGQMAAKGYRVLGVCSAQHPDDQFPVRQDDFHWKFIGLIGLYDPPRKNVAGVLKKVADAKIDVKIITGDYPATAVNIAGQVGIAKYRDYRVGVDVMNMTEKELSRVVRETAVFARMFPDAKVKVIDALKKNGEIVAMTGDGVNDSPALKLADIGIAMGKKGTETARMAADLVLTDDNLDRIVIAIREGRKIFSNFLKAVRYIISIHIPIILTASLPLLLGWKYPNIFTPVHVIFLELIMGPTCSIFFEREPVEKNLMLAAPRKPTKGLFTGAELRISIIQGLVITAGVLVLYHFKMQYHGIEATRTVVFTTLIIANVFLTFTDRSFSESINFTSRFKNSLAPVLIIISAGFLALLQFVPFIRNLFQLVKLSARDFWICFAVAFVCVAWFEVYKGIKRRSRTGG